MPRPMDRKRLNELAVIILAEQLEVAGVNPFSGPLPEWKERQWQEFRIKVARHIVTVLDGGSDGV